MGTLLDQAIAGVAVIPLTGGAGTYTVQALDGTQDQARCAVLLFTGSPSGAKVIEIPSTEKLYVVRNQSTQTITVKTAAQIADPLLGGVPLLPSEATLVFCDGSVALKGIQAEGVGVLGVSGGGTGQDNFATAGFLKTPGGQAGFTSVANINLDSADTSGVLPAAKGGTGGLLPVANGGTGISTTTPANGALLIGTSTGGYARNTLTQGTGITITNSSGGITISAAGGSGVTSVTASSPLSSSGGTTPNISISSTPTFSTVNFGNTSNNISQSSNELVFITGGTQANKFTSAGLGTFNINATGRLLLGTSGGGAGGNFNLDVTGQSNQTVAFFTTAGSAGNGITTNCTGGTTSAALFQNNGATTGQIICAPGGTTYNTLSDRRLKTDITPLLNAGPTIDAIQPRVFKWKSTGEMTTGFIADELQQIIPGSVTGEPNKVDQDGNPIYQGIDCATPEIISLMVAELQSLRKRVAELEAK
jgi:hypothetical protein